jgi:hypothetical protein
MDADDLTYRLLPGVLVRPFGEPHTQGLSEMLLEGGVVDGMREG